MTWTARLTPQCLPHSLFRHSEATVAWGRAVAISVAIALAGFGAAERLLASKKQEAPNQNTARRKLSPSQ